MNDNQAKKILRLIRQSGEAGVPNYRLAQISLKYSSRISELRQDGWNIEARRVFRNGKATGTFVYYIPEPVQISLV